MEKAKKIYSPLNFSIKRCYEPLWVEFTDIHIQSISGYCKIFQSNMQVVNQTAGCSITARGFS